MRSRYAKVRPFLLLAAILAVALAVGTLASGHSSPAATQEITTSAAVSLKDALDEAGKLYRSQEPGAVVHFNLGGSGTLRLQIEQGAPVDVFISAAPEDMDKLQSQGLLLSGTRKNLAGNEVVLIVPAGKNDIKSFKDLALPVVKHIAVGEPQTVPAGMYAQQILTHLGLYDGLKPKFVLAKDVRQVLTYVASGNADAGIVYATDARVSSNVRVVAEAPSGSHAPVIYPIAVIRTSRNPTAGKAFEDFLLGSQARSVFAKYGFLAPAQ
jgi:molybdate transport system substrate-binding protein